MFDIETNISPLISNMFPSFYQEEGPDFIAFVKVYYEWLEQNFQLIELEDASDFIEGDIITQSANVKGTIYSKTGNELLVKVEGLETFKCFNVCSELIPVVSSSGHSSLILKGGTSRRLGTYFLSRNLPNIRDIDKTVDLFILNFKEKYLKNIEFDTRTNKRLLIKNSLDLYRSKGTARSIDLFFRLVYGTKSSIYYPGDDLFRLSDAEWFVPRYIEINSTSVERAISFVGRQIIGVNSGSTAFVERYVKRQVRGGIVHAFYITQIQGNFEVGERLKVDEIFPDNPWVLGSPVAANIIDGSENFNIGDTITLQSDSGLGGEARVVHTEKGNGEVKFDIENTGWGFSINSSDSNNLHTTQTLLSDKIIILANVQPGQFISNINVENGGSNYTNNEIVTLSSRYVPATGVITTNTSGGVVSIRTLSKGGGFFPLEENPNISVTDTLGNPSVGTNLNVNPTFSFPKKYFDFYEELVLPLKFITYQNDLNIEQMVNGSLLDFNNFDNLGKLISIDTANNTMIVNPINQSVVQSGDIIFLDSNTSVKVDVITVTDQSVNGDLIFNGNTGTIRLGIIQGNITNGDIIYQVDSDGEVIASATIIRIDSLTLEGGFIGVTNIEGVFRPEQQILVKNKPNTFSTFKEISFTVAIDNSTSTFIDNFTPFVYTSNTGTKASIIGISSGANASYRITNIEDSENVRLNTDLLSNTLLLTQPLNSTSFGFTSDPTANINSYLFDTLTFEDFTLGSIKMIGEINPGTGYNRDPIAIPYQPYVTGLQAKDYIITISNNQSAFVEGEYITQTVSTLFAQFEISNTSIFTPGELVSLSNTSISNIANCTIVQIDNDIVVVTDIEGELPVTINSDYNLNRYIDLSSNVVINTTSISTGNTIIRGIIKQIIGSNLYVKRLQINNHFAVNNTIEGSRTRSTGVITQVIQDQETAPVGINAVIETEASTANGVITEVQITDSGFGFSNDNEIIFQASDGRQGIITGIRGGVGTGTGSYRNNKGFTSDISKLHDGDYYQEYSYDIFTRIPFDRYKEMFKQVMHTAGTRFFGSMLVESSADTQITYGGSVIEITGSSPYVIQDRDNDNIQDLRQENIEIRD